MWWRGPASHRFHCVSRAHMKLRLGDTWGSFVAPNSIVRCVSKRIRTKTTGDMDRSDTPCPLLCCASPRMWPVWVLSSPLLLESICTVTFALTREHVRLPIPSNIFLIMSSLNTGEWRISVSFVCKWANFLSFAAWFLFVGHLFLLHILWKRQRPALWGRISQHHAGQVKSHCC